VRNAETPFGVRPFGRSADREEGPTPRRVKDDRKVRTML
jgi:hypothetical protein